ncbi:hypothetical protein LCGC14_0428410 [marine sediment metagenome]|uniref:DNA 5'-3' helicase n=1 Tax=marine sediment metagenome TaxID=412755 RepID=A0A0F9VAU5_9ZZZZ
MVTEQLQMSPQDLEAEQAVLGAVLIDGKALSLAEAILKPVDFYKTANGIVFKAMMQLRDDSQPIDCLTLSSWLGAEDNLETIGGAFYLTGLTETVPSASRVEHYARIVSEAAQYRSLIDIGRKLIKQAQNGSEAPSALLAGIPTTMGNGNADYVHIAGPAKAVDENIRIMLEEPGKSRGMSTGLSKLDSYCGGIQKNDLVIIGARTSMGKTSLAIQIAWRAAKNNIPALIVTLESSDVDLVERLAIKESKVSSSRYQAGYLTAVEGADLHAATAKLSGLPLYLNDSAMQSAYTILASARHLSVRHGLGLIVIDFIQRLETYGRVERRIQLEDFCRKAKTIAKELNCPVIIVSQLSRKPEGRVATKQRPIMSDLKESGGIEEHADQVWLLYRPSFYGHKTYKDGSPTDNTCEIIVAKNRNGKRGASLRVAFIEEYMLFADLATDEPPPEQDDLPF